MAIEEPCRVCGAYKKPTVLRMFKKAITAFYCPHCDRPCKNKLSCTRCKKMLGWTGSGPKAPGKK